MFLSDGDIKKSLKNGEIIIKDFDKKRLQPASYDVLLGNDFLLFDRHMMGVIDPKDETSKHMRKIHVADDESFMLHPHEFALAVTKDYFGTNANLCCQLMGKSSLARLGLIIHTTAGFIDPGNELCPTLELFNTNSLPVKLYPGMKIAQVAFCRLETPAERPYGHPDLGSKYYKSQSVESSQMWKNFKKSTRKKNGKTK